MKSLVYGNRSFDRDFIPNEIKDLSTWPTVDVTALSPDAQIEFNAKVEALRIFIEQPHTSLASIKTLTGVHPQSLYRLLARCLAKHADGRIYGFRAAIPFARLKQYERIQPPKEGGETSGQTGAFNQLLQRYPSIEKYLKRALRERNKQITSAREVRKSLKRIHKGFIEECRKAGIKANQYPFTQSLLGVRSLSTYLKKQAEASFSSAARNAGASRVGPPASSRPPAPPATRAYEAVEFDGHKIDLRITLRVSDPFGLETLVELHRIWILVLLDVATRAVIGYSLALGKEYDKDDVASALQAALVRHKPPKSVIPGLVVRDGGGYPSSVLPQTEYACWDWFRFDGARCHLASDTLERLSKIVGCWIDNGPVGEPDARPFIERFFQLIAQHFAHRLPGTTGSDPSSIERILGDPKGDLSMLVELDELEQMIDVLLADYNGEAHDGLGGRTPLEAMNYMVRKQEGFLRTLAQTVRPNLCLLQEAKPVPIRGSLQSGVRPHVNFLGVKYTSDILSNSASLIGKTLRVYFDVRDIRVLKAFFADGSELGILTAKKPWCYTPHSVRIRKDILRLKRIGKLKYREGDDPIEAWVKYKRAESRTAKKAGNALAKFQRQEREASASPLFHPLPKQTERPAPSTETVSEEVAAPEPQPEKKPPKPRPMRIKRTLTF